MRLNITASAILLLCLLHTPHAYAQRHKSTHTQSVQQAQEEMGTITGKIMGDLKPVNGARLTLLKHDEVIDATTTDENGYYSFRYVDTGCYTIKSDKEGYRTYITTAVPVVSEHITKLDLYTPMINNSHMPVGPITERYVYPRKWVKDLRKEDYAIEMSNNLE